MNSRSYTRDNNFRLTSTLSKAKSRLQKSANATDSLDITKPQRQRLYHIGEYNMQNIPQLPSCRTSFELGRRVDVVVGFRAAKQPPFTTSKCGVAIRSM